MKKGSKRGEGVWLDVVGGLGTPDGRVNLGVRDVMFLA
jgi:hypothetical protein